MYHIFLVRLILILILFVIYLTNNYFSDLVIPPSLVKFLVVLLIKGKLKFDCCCSLILEVSVSVFNFYYIELFNDKNLVFKSVSEIILKLFRLLLILLDEYLLSLNDI